MKPIAKFVMAAFAATALIPAAVMGQSAAVIAALPPPAPAKVLTQKFSFSGDALFAFDKPVLKPEGKVMLDDLVSQLSGVSYDKIVTAGHTGRFGSNAYNQALSERRVDVEMTGTATLVGAR